jgi:hypothetical protein
MLETISFESHIYKGMAPHKQAKRPKKAQLPKIQLKGIVGVSLTLISAQISFFELTHKHNSVLFSHHSKAQLAFLDSMAST